MEMVRTSLLMSNSPADYSLSTGLLAGMVIGLPPVLNFGSEELKARIVPEVFAGKKFICLAISEAFAGSDVAGLKTTAEKTADGSRFIPQHARNSLSLST